MIFLIAILLAIAFASRAGIIVPPVYRTLRVDAYPCFEPAFPYRLAMQTAATGIAPPNWFPSNVYTEYQLNPNDPVAIHRTRQKSTCQNLQSDTPSVFRWGIHTGDIDWCTLHPGTLVEFPATQILSFITTNPQNNPYNISYVIPVRSQLAAQDTFSFPWYDQCSFGDFFNLPTSQLVCHSRGENTLGYLTSDLRPFALASWCAPLDGQGNATKPARIGAYTLYHLSGNPFYPGGPGGLDNSHGFGVSARHGLTIQDMQRANEYQWMTLTPVEPVQFYPWLPEQPPYPPGAENNFLFEGPTTYEIPCVVNNSENPPTPPVPESIRRAYLNRIFKWQADEIVAEETPSMFSPSFIQDNRNVMPDVPRGARAIVAYSSKDPRPGYLPWYCQNNTYDDFWLGQTSLGSIIENLWRYYHGVTETRRVVWEQDPQQRGWGFAEFAFVHGWFTQECLWHYYGNDDPPPRWSAWYCGGVQVRITGGGDVNDSAFRAWILSHDSGFGVLYEPRSAVCNDVLSGCVGQPNALGEHVFPDAQTQGSSSWIPPAGQPSPTPCQQRGTVSRSFRWFDNSPCSHWNKGPHCGLYHEIKRKRFTAPDYTAFQEQFGWAKLAFSTTPPKVVSL